MSINSQGVHIELRGVSKVHPLQGGGFAALRDVDLRIARGEFVAVVGKSGSGKSTLLNLVTGIDRPSGGEILVGGTRVHALGESRLAAWRGSHVGVVFQFFQLLPTMTILENVMLPMDLCGTRRPREAKARALALLEEVGIADHAGKLPSSLSGGEQQRAAMARALANDPPLVVADEPTGNLDSRTAADVLSLLARTAARGKTVLMVTHERDVAGLVDRVVTLSDGRIVDDGASAALRGEASRG